MQLTVALVRAAHGRPQPPQLLTSVNPLTSHPSAAIMLQSPKPALQVKVHASPLPQRGIVAFTGAAQGVIVLPSPSELHTVRVVDPLGQVAVPGVHVQPEHMVPA